MTKTNTEVLIVGAGPTGLMMACQLINLGISFRIIDKAKDRTHESRAIGIQARSMEILQKLNLSEEFLSRARTADEIYIYINGKQKLKVDLKNYKIAADTSFPSVYFLPQPETEEILLNVVETHQQVERNTELVTFEQSKNGVTALIKTAQNEEQIQCQYLVGCDGAHSTVRKTLGFEFIGSSYDQEFLLADGKLEWPLKHNGFRIFFSKKGIFGHIQLWEDAGRVIGAQTNHPESSERLTVAEIEKVGTEITTMPVKLKDVFWMSRFHLHHRAVEHYSKGRIFLAGDSAHIHTPLGAQGMNTGFQDVTNLAWKIAFVLKNYSSPELLKTYELERQPVGETLVKTTDRAFGLITAQGLKGVLIRNFLLPIFLKYVQKTPKLQDKLFLFASQLRVKYNTNVFIFEDTQHANQRFLYGPKAGERAPDAKIGNKTLFELFRNNFCNLLIFKSEKDFCDLKFLEKYISIMNILELESSVENKIAFQRYGINDSGIYFIRPDGYIGFRCYRLNTATLKSYIDKLLNKL